MDTAAILNELEAEKERLDAAISALQGSRYGKPRSSGRRGRRTMSAEARRKISLAQKARWKKQKAKAA